MAWAGGWEEPTEFVATLDAEDGNEDTPWI